MAIGYWKILETMFLEKRNLNQCFAYKSCWIMLGFLVICE